MTAADRVLIAEDTDIQAKKLQFYLEKDHYQVTRAANGVEALGYLEKNAYDLIITDIQMPEMDGLELLKRVKKQTQLSRIPVIVLTTLADDQYCFEALASGASEFLMKPFRPEELSLRAKNLIRLRKFEKAILEQNVTLSSELIKKNKTLEAQLKVLDKAHEQLKIAQSQMVETARMGMFATIGAAIAHQINNPLAVISLLAQQLRGRSEQGTGGDQRPWDQIDAAIKRIELLVAHIKSVSQADGLEAPVEELDLGAVLEGLQDYFEAYSKSRLVQVEVQPMERGFTVSSTRRDLERVFLNLVFNAMDAVQQSDQKRIEVRMKTDATEARVEIVDTGVGIASERLATIFEPFHSNKSKGDGLGVGLAVARSLVQNLGGRMECQSQLGQGSTFTVIFPRTQQSVQRKAS